MSRTNIDIDDELVEIVMERYRLSSKRAAVDLALRHVVGIPMTADEVLGMAGVGLDFDNEEIEAMSSVDGVA